jgi:hypothetical protein
MKILLFKCNLCDNKIKKMIRDGEQVPAFLSCECGGVMEKDLPDISTTSVEVLDNGFQARRTEVRKDAKRKFKERGDLYVKTMEERDKVKKD